MSNSGADSRPPPDPVDPRDDTVLPPWIWLTLCTLSLACLLFISFRRAKSLELYERAKNHLRRKLPFPSLHRGIRLSEQDLEADSLFPPARRSSPSHDDLSDTSSVHSADDADELPRASVAPLSNSGGFPSRHAYTLDTSPARTLAASALATLQRGADSTAGTLGWGTKRGVRALRGEGDKNAGIARAFWGLRKGERAGGIKLGEGQGGLLREEVAAPAGAARPSEPTSRSHSSAASTTGTALFDLGGDAETGDAVELPSQFNLSSQGSTPG